MSNDEHLAILRSGVASWNDWRARTDEPPDLANASLAEMDLPHVNLAGANLEGADLSGCNLGGAALSSGRMRQINFDKARLKGADLRKADLTGATLRGADLERGNLSDAYLQDARLHAVNARFADLQGAQGFRAEFGSFLPDFPQAADLTGAMLNRAWFPSARFAGSILDDVKARHADFSEADMYSVSAQRIDLRRSRLRDAHLGK